MIEQVFKRDEAVYCDTLLTQLIQDESKYDSSIDPDFIVKDYFSNTIKNKNNILLAYKIDSKIVGYIFLKQVVSDDSTGYIIDGLYVLANYRQNGIAKKLIAKSLDILQEKHVPFIDINVMAENTIALNLYKYFGFKEFRVQMRKK